MNPEKKKQQTLKKYEKKLDALMAEMGEELIGKAELTKLEKKLRNMFAEKNVTFQLSTLKAFDEGARFAIASMQHEGVSQTMLIALRSIIKQKESDLDTFMETVAISGDEKENETKK